MISNRQLLSALTAAGIPERACLLFDMDYELPEPSWITGELSRSFAKFLFDTGIKFTDEQFDCNAFSMSAVTIARWAWVKTRLDEAALAFGMIAIPGHMVCVGVHKEGVKFYEPQPSVPDNMAVFAPITLREITLAPEELNACVACIFV